MSTRLRCPTSSNPVAVIDYCRTVRGVSRFRRPTLNRWQIAFGLALLAGVALRVWVYRSRLGIPNSDEAAWGLMALHAMHGQFTTFLWGQAYGGSQESLLTVPVFWLFGPSWVALRAVPIALHAVAALLV